MLYQLIMQTRQNYKERLLGLIFLMNLIKVNQITQNFYISPLH